MKLNYYVMDFWYSGIPGFFIGLKVSLWSSLLGLAFFMHLSSKDHAAYVIPNNSNFEVLQYFKQFAKEVGEPEAIIYDASREY